MPTNLLSITIAPEDVSTNININALLPYRADDGLGLVRTAVERLSEGLASLDVLVLYDAFDRLEIVLELKYVFSEKLLLPLIDALYLLVINPDLVQVTAEPRQSAARILRRLLRQAKHARLSLCFGWRPLAAIIDHYLFPPHNHERLGSEQSHLQQVLILAGKMKRHFGADADEEIWSEFQLTPVSDGESYARSLAFLLLLLPVESREFAATKVIPSVADTDSPFWAYRTQSYDSIRVCLLARVAKRFPDLISGKVVGIVFDMFYDHIRFPLPADAKAGSGSGCLAAGKAQKGSRIIFESKKSKSYGAKFCAHMLSNQDFLRCWGEFAKSIDSLCHPSNSGQWSGEIAVFLSQIVGLAAMLAQRRSISPERSFLENSWSILKNLMISKGPTAQLSASVAIKYLCSIDTFFVPELLQLTTDSLMNLNEPLRTRALIGTVSGCIRSLSTTPFVADTICLLELLLPSIDPNDPVKTFDVLFFVINFATNVSFAAPEGQPDLLDAYARMECICAVFVERLLNFVRHMPRIGDIKEVKNQDSGAAQLLALPKDLHGLVLEKLRQFVFEETLYNAVDLIGKMANALLATTPQVALQSLLPPMFDEIGALVGQGHGGQKSETDESNERLLYLTRISVALLANCSAVSVFGEQIFDLFLRLTQSKQRSVVRYACKALRNFFKSLLGQYPLESRSSNPGDSANSYAPSGVTLQRHVASSAEIAIFERLLAKLVDAILGDAVSASDYWYFFTQLKNAVKILNYAWTLTDKHVRLSAYQFSIDFSAVASRIGRHVLSLQEPMLHQPVEVQELFVMIAGRLAITSSVNTSNVDRISSTFQLLKQMAIRYPKDKLLPRSVVIVKSSLVMSLRTKNALLLANKVRGPSPFTQTLYSFSIGAYSSVRRVAQAYLYAAQIEAFAFPKTVLGEVEGTLRTPGIAKEAYKGCMHMLKGGELFSILYIDSSMLLGAFELIEHLCQTQAFANLEWATRNGSSSNWWLQLVAAHLLDVALDACKAVEAGVSRLLIQLSVSEVVQTRHAAIRSFNRFEHTRCPLSGQLIEQTVESMLSWQVHVETGRDFFRDSQARFAEQLGCVSEDAIPAVLPRLRQLLETGLPGRHRALAEWIAGFLRHGDREDVLVLLDASWRSVDLDLINNVWYPAFKFIYRHHPDPRLRLQLLTARIRAKLDDASRSEGSSSLQLVLYIRLLQAVYRCGGPAFHCGADFDIFAKQLASPFDGVRKALARLVTYWVMMGSDARANASKVVRVVQQDEHQKFLLAWLGDSMELPNVTCFWSSFIECFAQVVRIKGASAGDVDMHTDAKKLLMRASWTRACSAAQANELMGLVLSLASASAEPQERKAAVKFATAFLSRYYLSIADAGFDAILRLTEDPLVDVHDEATGLLQCYFATHKDAADAFAKQLTLKLKGSSSSTPLPHCIQAFALVKAFPYTIPAWMPPLLASLPRFLRLPASSSTVKRLFADFKRTHADAWQEHRGQFSEEQLDAVNELLVGPSYYA